MKPVYQTIFAPPLGNCFPACVASVLEIPLEYVPHPTEEDAETDWETYWPRFYEWVKAHGYGYVELASPSLGWFPQGYSILIGMSPRNYSWRHAVVVKDGKLVHDPAPPNENCAEGVLTKEAYGIFYPLDPAF